MVGLEGWGNLLRHDEGHSRGNWSHCGGRSLVSATGHSQLCWSHTARMHAVLQKQRGHK